MESFSADRKAGELIRRIQRRDGTISESRVPVADDQQLRNGDDLAAAYDYAWLRCTQIPQAEPSAPQIRIVDLFAGCGGMTVGVAEACRALKMVARPLLAVDVDEVALEVYDHNLPSLFAKSLPAPLLMSNGVEELLPGDVGDPLSEKERRLRNSVGPVDLLLGGPPCQGHSNLNNHTRRNDGRNALFAKMARFAEIVNPEHVVVENVIGVMHDKNDVYTKTWRYLEELGYSVDGGIVRGDDIGVPQRRARVFLIASRSKPVSLLGSIAGFKTAPRSFTWACGDLGYSEDGSNPFQTPVTPAPVTAERIQYLFREGLYNLPNSQRPPCHRDKKHSYHAVYGRLYPNEPVGTITTGFMVMGQGRYVHPTEPRTLTPHEGASLQFFPDCFDFGNRNRKQYASLIGNAVPPKLSYVIAVDLLR